MYSISEKELNSIEQQLFNQRGIWVAEIDGRKVPTWKDYAHEIERAFRFPTPCDKSMDAYLDWMTDLSWLNAKGYALIIKNVKDFIRSDPEKKEKVLHFFKDDILPFWQSDVEKYVVEGKAKPFNVYIIE
ncbi:Barstar (barnase inhibitor) [Papillibacter cinnamivorans DSM 12816]|uniref:Barstar (Barnase inhibitor) n=2 Tax=Papillibacter TaxID=100175 RepID=A0A1W2C6M9_9FIRM|nr:Barstar (barnase inhibitor) [Papillibacter cinnamivorans DSM 12816]